MSRLVLISGPSGVGKTTVSIAAADRLDANVGVSHTTRAPRPGEVDGTDYHFVTEHTFLRLRANGRLMEWTQYPGPAGAFYGLAVSEWVQAVRADRDLIVVMEPNGVRSALRFMGAQASRDAVASIFLMPMNYAQLAGRMADRGDDPPSIAVRLADARQMVMRDASAYDYTVFTTDGDVERTVESVCRIVRGARIGMGAVR